MTTGDEARAPHPKGQGAPLFFASDLLSGEEGVKGKKVGRTIRPSKGMEAARTGKVGDGKIGVSDFPRVIQSRTGETGEAALRPVWMSFAFTAGQRRMRCDSGKAISSLC